VAYEQRFTLNDIFTNKRIRDRFGVYVDLKSKYERKTIGGTGTNTVAVNTQMANVSDIVFNTSVGAAQPYYSNMSAARNGAETVISGELRLTLDGAHEAVYNAIVGARMAIQWTANNMGAVRDALKEGEKQSPFGNRPKLWLRQKSMESVYALNNQQFSVFLGDVMNNLYFGDQFPKTQKKLVGDMNTFTARMGFDYKQAKADWQRKVNGI
jgi:hypothetical protein